MSVVLENSFVHLHISSPVSEVMLYIYVHVDCSTSTFEYLNWHCTNLSSIHSFSNPVKFRDQIACMAIHVYNVMSE